MYDMTTFARRVGEGVMVSARVGGGRCANGRLGDEGE